MDKGIQSIRKEIMSNTPETDAALVDHMPADDNEWSQCYLDLSRLCRKLEQERDANRAIIETQRELIDTLKNQLEEAANQMLDLWKDLP